MDWPGWLSSPVVGLGLGFGIFAALVGGFYLARWIWFDLIPRLWWHD